MSRPSAGFEDETWAPWAKWCGLLESKRQNDRWILMAATRNAPAESELADHMGVHGIRRPELIEHVASVLERGYQFLTSHGWPRLQPGEPRVRVYLFAVEDPYHGCGCPITTQFVFVAPHAGGNLVRGLATVITLPSRNNDPKWEGELAHTLTCAIHELSHALHIQELALRDPMLGKRALDETKVRTALRYSWQWLDEGMAVAAEAAFAESEQGKSPGERLPVADDWQRYGLDWVDRPERSLDDPKYVYQSAFFVRYVNKLMGEEFLHNVWRSSGAIWASALPGDCCALTKLARFFSEKDRVFCSSTEHDVFASGYCFDSYFLNDDTMKAAYEPRIFARFGERAVTRVWSGGSLIWPKIDEAYELPGLACRYFRFVPSEESQKLTVRVRVAENSGGEIKNLKVEIALARNLSGPRGGYVCKRDQDGNPIRHRAQGTGELVCEIKQFSKKECDHAVLVVTHCDYSSSPPQDIPLNGYTHHIEFVIDAVLTRS